MNSIFSFFFRIAVALFLVMSMLSSVAFASQDLRSLWQVGFYKNHEQLAEVFREGGLTKDSIYNMQDSGDNNLAHKIFYYLKEATKKRHIDAEEIADYLYSIEKLHKLCGDALFEEENDHRKTPFSASPIKFKEISEQVGHYINLSLIPLLRKNGHDFPLTPNDLWDNRLYSDHVELRKFFEEGFIDISAMYAKEDNYGENLAHKILKNLKQAYLNYQIKIGDGETPDSQEIVDYLYALGRLYEVCGNNIFERQNKEGETPFIAYSSGKFPIKFSKLLAQIGFRQFPPNLMDLLIRNYEVLLNTDPDFFLITLQKNITPLYSSKMKMLIFKLIFRSLTSDFKSLR